MKLLKLLLVLLIFSLWAPWFSSCFAQTLVMTVNGDPVTNVDIDNQMKLLRILHEPASRDAAIESVISDRLKLQQAKLFSVTSGQADIYSEIEQAAQKARTSPQELANALAHSGIPERQLKDHWEAEASFRFFVRALNRSVEPSDNEVRQAVSEKGIKSAGLTYTLQEVSFVTHGAVTEAQLVQRHREAEQLRSQFNDCTTGVEKARALPDVVVKPPFNRSAVGLPEKFVALLGQTPIGHLTPPERDASGFSMLAVCERTNSDDLSLQREAVKDYALKKKFDPAVAQTYAEIRARAVITRR